MYQLKSSQAERNFSLVLPFLLFRPLMDWIRPTHMRRAICFTQFTYSIVNLIQKHPSRHIKNNV
jgi:hypothetical protein